MLRAIRKTDLLARYGGEEFSVLLPETRSPKPFGPHPGDILYWVACLGGACLLLLCATT